MVDRKSGQMDRGDFEVKIKVDDCEIIVDNYGNVTIVDCNEGAYITLPVNAARFLVKGVGRAVYQAEKLAEDMGQPFPMEG